MTTPPICSLPPELLLAIFSLCTLKNHRLPNHLTHDARSPEWFDELLARTDDLPLHINMRLEPGPVEGVHMRKSPRIARLLGPVHRARILELELEKDDEFRVFIQLPSPLPLLERLSVRSSVVNELIELADWVLDGRSPMLHRLELDWTKIPK